MKFKEYNTVGIFYMKFQRTASGNKNIMYLLNINYLIINKKKSNTTKYLIVFIHM